MFRAILFTQWKWTRALILPFVIAIFAVPIYSVGAFSEAGLSRSQVAPLLGSMQGWGLTYMMATVFMGMLIAAGAWSFDTKGKHVYALSLPLPRWHYLLLRYAAGILILFVPAFFLWIGGLVATSSAEIPIGLHAYPTALALRFLLACFLSYSLMFAISGLPKKVGIGIAVAAGVLVLTDAALGQVMGKSVLLSGLFDWVIRWPGFLEVFAGRWMLIDV